MSVPESWLVLGREQGQGGTLHPVFGFCGPNIHGPLFMVLFESSLKATDGKQCFFCQGTECSQSKGRARARLVSG